MEQVLHLVCLSRTWEGTFVGPFWNPSGTFMEKAQHLACLYRIWAGTGRPREDQLSWTSSRWNPVHKSRLWTCKFSGMQFYRFLFLIDLKVLPPWFLLSCLFCSKILHGGDKAMLGDHIVLQLDIIPSPLLGKHHQKFEVKKCEVKPWQTSSEIWSPATVLLATSPGPCYHLSRTRVRWRTNFRLGFWGFTKGLL